MIENSILSLEFIQVERWNAKLGFARWLSARDSGKCDEAFNIARVFYD
jgi:hypothetical protein